MLTAQNTKQNTHFKFITSNKTNAKVKKKNKNKLPMYGNGKYAKPNIRSRELK